MSVQEQKIKRKIQIIVASCLSLFFILVTVVVFQFAIRINQKNQENSLNAQNAALEKQIDQAQHDKAYFESDEFKEDYALHYLNKGKPGDKIFD